jgi:hypothetical protein
MDPVKCFFMEKINSVQLLLRRYSTVGKCIVPKQGYHNAHALIERKIIDWDENAPPYYDPKEYEGDPRWPVRCACGYEFLNTDTKQVFTDDIYKRTDTDEILLLRDAVPGAMWYVDWYLTHKIVQFHAGPDGHCLCVRLPNHHDWVIDSRCNNCTRPDEPHDCWVRHGAVPNITVDKNGNTCSAGGGSIQSGDFHGFLQNGFLVKV